MAGFIIGLVVCLLTALIMVGIGISQLKSKKPVGFYSGEEPPRENQLKDVQMWNKKHGWMWIMYGITIIISYLIGMLAGDSVWCVIPVCGGAIVPVFFMIWYHHKLMREYMIK